MTGRPKGSGVKKVVLKKVSVKKDNSTFELAKSIGMPEEDANILQDADDSYDSVEDIQPNKKVSIKIPESPKDSHSEAIQNLRDTLDSTGIEYLKSDDITQLSIKLNRGIKEMGPTDASKVDSDSAIKTWGGNTQITQLDFLRRLKKMGIRPFWVRGIVNRKNPDAPLKFLFDDAHSKLPDREIHRIIRHSNITETNQKKNLRNVGDQPAIPLRYRGGMGANVSTGTNW